MTAAPQSEAELLCRLEYLIVAVARRYTSRSLWLAAVQDDYVQLLRLEAVRAMRRWSPDGGASLSTYVYHALHKESLNVLRDERLRPLSYRGRRANAPQVLSLDVPCNDADGDASLWLDLLVGLGDTFGEAAARGHVERAWALVDELLGDKPRVRASLELYAGRRGTPLSQRDIAARLGCAQMSVSRWLRQARALLLADPRSREFLEP